MRRDSTTDITSIQPITCGKYNNKSNLEISDMSINKYYNNDDFTLLNSHIISKVKVRDLMCMHVYKGRFDRIQLCQSLLIPGGVSVYYSRPSHVVRVEC